eukprot:3700582-Rhodomonas_salina.2
MVPGLLVAGGGLRCVFSSRVRLEFVFDTETLHLWNVLGLERREEVLVFERQRRFHLLLVP